MEKQLKYTIDDEAIAELFGRQNFSTRESAIFELVKNSFDSGAKNCHISLQNDSITIIDNGDGMDQSIIENQWMHVGRSCKGYYDRKHNRVLAGSKGIGRFALARLGNHIELLSNPGNDKAIKWTTNWAESFISSVKYLEKGTKITINQLREKVRKKDVDKLVDFLCRSYNSTAMKLTVEWKTEIYNILPLYQQLVLGEDYTSKIMLQYCAESCTLSVVVSNDEFREDVAPIISPISPTSYTKTLDIFQEISATDQDDTEKKELRMILEGLGSFSAEFYFGIRSNTELRNKFYYKHQTLSRENSFGVILYRNNFSISSYDGKKDWLEIEARSRKSPAAATHPTGSWRIRYNQIDGFVLIDKKINEFLVDLSNRQGLDENDFYLIFIEIISKGIAQFEKYRQSIIRKIYRYNKEIINDKDNKNTSDTLKQFLKQPEKAEKMSQEELKEIAKDIQNMQKMQREEKKEKKNFEQKIAYENRILNVLATQGLRASSVAHEYHTKNNAIGSTTQYIISALKEFGYWEDLNSSEKTNKQFRNIPSLLKQNEEINLIIGRFMEAMLKKVEKKNFSKPVTAIEESLEKILDVWRQGYSWISINCEVINNTASNKIYSDLLTVIFDNLILNSIQHNEEMKPLNISIKINCIGKVYYVEYADNGVGLAEKYRSNPERILEVHETSRTDGHGLGMWMVNTSLLRNGGKVTNITNEHGFKIEFYFGGQ